MREAGAVLLVVLLLVAVTWGVLALNYGTFAFWAPKYARVERQVFQQTPSYTQGTVGELYNMMYEYLKVTDPKAKESMASIILHRADEYAATGNALPPDLGTFISGLRSGTMAPTSAGGKY